MRTALPHVYSEWVNDPDDEARLVFIGRMRLVRSPKRHRVLRKRGVEFLDTGERTARGHTVWAWFTPIESGQHDPSQQDREA